MADSTIEDFELNVVGAEGTSCDGQFVQWGTYCVGAVGFDFFHCLCRCMCVTGVEGGDLEEGLEFAETLDDVCQGDTLRDRGCVAIVPAAIDVTT